MFDFNSHLHCLKGLSESIIADLFLMDDQSARFDSLSIMLAELNEEAVRIAQDIGKNLPKLSSPEQVPANAYGDDLVPVLGKEFVARVKRLEFMGDSIVSFYKQRMETEIKPPLSREPWVKVQFAVHTLFTTLGTLVQGIARILIAARLQMVIDAHAGQAVS